MNEQLISLSDESLDAVAGGATATVSVTVPTVGEVVEAGVGAVKGVADAAIKGVGGILGALTFGIGFKITK